MSNLRWFCFLQDQSGGGTVWGLLMFILMTGICGLAVDVTDAFRNKTGLQATADAAALAASIDLPDEAAALATAQVYAEINMPSATYGTVLRPEDVQFGIWDPDTRTFHLGETPADAVHVRLRRSAASGNALPMNFLRIVGLGTWNEITVEAVAHVFYTGCLGDGLFSRQVVDISSNNNFIQNICVHGEQGVAMQSNNYYETGVTVSMPDPDTMLKIPAGGMESNPGLGEALQTQSLGLEMIDDLPDIIAKFKNPSLDVDEPAVIPDYINTSLPVIVVGSGFDFSMLAEDSEDYCEPSCTNRIIHVQCPEETSINIPRDLTYRNFALVADCRINVESNATFENVALLSSAVGNGDNPLDMHNISFASNVQLGAADNCAEGGGVQIYSAASVHFSSTMLIHGLQTVAAGTVELGARDHGIHGISVQAGQDITMTSNNELGLCSGGADGVFTHREFHLVN